MNTYIDKIFTSDCVDFMTQLDTKSIDLVVTSPPYDNLRKYNGYSFNFRRIAEELFRIIKQGGVVVWVVGDQTVDGSETGESFRQAIGFMDVGFKLHDTMIYAKDPRYPQKNRYGNSFEYMFILSKGEPATFNPIKRSTINRGYNKFVTNRNYDGELTGRRYTSPKESPLYNIWYYSSGFMKTTKDEIAYNHPAIFPDDLAGDHIRSWSNVGDLVFDPFCGSGTTCKMAKELNRHYLGCDISEEYVKIAEERLKNVFVKVDDMGHEGMEWMEEYE